MRTGIVKPFKKGDYALHPVSQGAQSSDPARCRLIQKVPQDQEQLCPPQGLAAGRNTLRQMPRGLPVSLRSGSSGHILVMKPDPDLIVLVISLLDLVREDVGHAVDRLPFSTCSTA